MKNILITFLLVFCLFNCTTQHEKTQVLEFKTTLEQHLASIQSRDLKKLASTISDSVMLIFPDGTLLRSKSEFLNFHTSWFADSAWEVKPSILRVEESEELSYALIKYQYTELHSAGGEISTRSNYLQLIFKKYPQGWLLIHDQNTGIRAASNDKQE